MTVNLTITKLLANGKNNNLKLIVSDNKFNFIKTNIIKRKFGKHHDLINDLLKAKVYLYSDYLTDEEILLAGFNPVKDINTTINELVEVIGSQPTLCVLPEGPQTIPFIN